MKSLAAILVENRKPLVIGEIEVPPLRIGQVLVKVMCSGICGSQLGEIEGVKGPDKFLPHLLGHEGGGIVMDIGPGVSTVRKDDHVVLHWRKAHGIESDPPKYAWNGRSVNAGWVTTFNEYAVVSENRVTTVPQSLNFEISALMGCAVTTGLGVIVNDAKLKIGESVAIFGAGGVGLSVTQGASLTSAYPIAVVDILENRLFLARAVGATHPINIRTDDIRSQFEKIFGRTGPDVIIETTGQTSMIELAYDLSAPKGRVILVGVPAKGQNISIYSLPLHFGKILTGSHGGEAIPDEDIPRYVKLYEAGKLDLQKLITDRFSLKDINTALDRLRSGATVGRCIVTMQ